MQLSELHVVMEALRIYMGSRRRLIKHQGKEFLEAFLVPKSKGDLYIDRSVTDKNTK